MRTSPRFGFGIVVAEEEVARELDRVAQLAAEQRVHGHAELLADDVEARELDRRVQLRAVVVEARGRVADREAHRLEAEDVVAAQIAGERGERARGVLAAAAHLAQADVAVGGLDLDDRAHEAAPVRAVAVQDRRLERHGDRRGADRGDRGGGHRRGGVASGRRGGDRRAAAHCTPALSVPAGPALLALRSTELVIPLDQLPGPGLAFAQSVAVRRQRAAPARQARTPGFVPMPFQSIEPRRLYRQIADQIRGLIRSGEFSPGARLPPERDLAKQLGVSRPSVREALIALEVEGLVEVRIGSGIYVLGADAEGEAATSRPPCTRRPDRSSCCAPAT